MVFLLLPNDKVAGSNYPITYNSIPFVLPQNFEAQSATAICTGKGHGSRLLRQKVLWLRFSRVGYHSDTGAKFLGHQALGTDVLGLRYWGRW